MARTAPYKHADGSPCWTKNCSLNHIPDNGINSLQQKISSLFKPLAPEDVKPFGQYKTGEYESGYKIFPEDNDFIEKASKTRGFQDALDYVTRYFTNGDRSKITIKSDVRREQGVAWIYFEIDDNLHLIERTTQVVTVTDNGTTLIGGILHKKGLGRYGHFSYDASNVMKVM